MNQIDPRSPEYGPMDKTCPRCGEIMTSDDQRVKVRGRWFEWVDYYCKCGFVDSGEPDWEDE